MLNEKVPNKVIDLIKIIQNNGYEIYLVGGCVRDLIMGNEPHDWDMCTNAEPLELVILFNKEHLTINPKGLAFGTVTVWFHNEEFEITTYREDMTYGDGRHPDSINFVKNIETDLARRDFTINAIAYNPISDTLCDCFNGKEDIKNGIIRCVGNANDRFEEDGLRILRALRFAIKYGFSIDKNTKTGMFSNLDNLDSVSKERITQELEKMLVCGRPISKYFIEYVDIIVKIFPELKPCVNFNQNNKHHKHNVYEHLLAVTDLCKTNNFVIKLAGLLHDIGKPNVYTVDKQGNGHFYGHPDKSYEILKESLRVNLRLTSEQYCKLLELVKYHDMSIPSSKKAVRRLIRNFGTEFLDDWFILRQADRDDHIFSEKDEWSLLSPCIETYNLILQEESCFTIKDLAVNGKDIMKELQLKQGKEIGVILNKLLDLVISEEVENTKENLLKIAHTCI